MPIPDKNEFGRYITKGLDEKAFVRVFRRIEQEQRRNRRQAKRSLTPSMMKTRTVGDLISLGRKKKDGLFFTLEDIQQLNQARKSHAKKFNRLVAGITYAELISGSLKIDVDRANNRVTDGRGISSATIIMLQNNQLRIRVKASSASVYEDHAVRIRMEEWDEQLQTCPPTDPGYAKAVKVACAGRVSFDCDCGRHQYWYRHLATVGNYALAPPKEFAPPKIKNPEYKGVACKHVIKAMTMLQSTSWQRLLVRQMKIQADKRGYGDDNKAHFFTDEEAREGRRNRKTTVNQTRIRAEHARYLASQEALGKKIGATQEQLKKLRANATKTRKRSQEAMAREAVAKRKARQAEKENAALKKMLAAQMKLQKQAFIDAFIASGKSITQAREAYAVWLDKQGITNDL